MKKLLLTLIIFGFCLQMKAQTDPWKCINTNGFGDVKNIACSQFFTFKGNLFTSTQRQTGNPPAQVWYSATGDSATWTKVTSYSPALSNADISIFCGGTTDTSGGITFISTLNLITGTAMYSSTNGISWAKINTNGFGSSANYRTSPTIVVFKDSLYAATWNNSGAQIWRCHSTNTSVSGWTKVIDFATVDTVIKDMTYLYVWNGSLYAATNGNSTSGCRLYQTTNGSAWAKNTGVGNGFGTPQNNVIASLINYQGFLYAGTLNQSTGAQLWRTPDGITWTQITANAFGQGTIIRELKRMTIAGGILFVSGNPSTGNSDEVWKSSNGLTFAQSNINGFGDVNNASFPILGTYNDNVYYGGENTITGGQIWRTCVNPVAGFKLSATTACQGSTLTFTDTSLYAHAYIWKVNGVNYSTAVDTAKTFGAAGNYTITLVANNGVCSNTYSTTVTINGCMGIDQVRIEGTQFSIWPNPSSSILNVELRMPNEKAEVQVTGILGNVLIHNSEIVNQKCALDVSSLPAGVYFIRLGTATQKFIKQ